MRTRSHILEDESRTQFKLTLPSEWVVRDKTNDYGIDCEVEIFDQKGQPSGFVFWVQLKATDSGIGASQRSFRIKSSKLRQLVNYPIPVLFVRYSSKEKVFYLNWARRVGLINSNKTNNTVNIEFADSDIWNQQTPNRIIQYFEKVRAIKDGQFRLPIKSFIETKDPELDISHFFSLRSLLSQKTTTIDLLREERDAYLHILLLPERIVLSLMDVYGASFHFGKKGSNDFDAKKVADLVFIGLLVIFSKQKRYDFFNHILEEIDLQEPLKEIPQLLNFLIPHLLNGGNLEKNLGFILECIEKSEDATLGFITSMELLFMRESPSPSTTKAILLFFERRLKWSEDNGNAKSISTDMYNLGHFF